MGMNGGLNDVAESNTYLCVRPCCNCWLYGAMSLFDMPWPAIMMMWDRANTLRLMTYN